MPPGRRPPKTIQLVKHDEMQLSVDPQRQFWDAWVVKSAEWEANPQNARRAEFVLRTLRSATAPPGRVLDVGCGSGWLARKLAALGYQVTGQDLAVAAMQQLSRTHPEVRWIGGDFMAVELPSRHFDAIVCMETIAHVPDQAAFVARLADLLVPGGVLALTTQNPYVWNRTSTLQPPGPGQIRNWPSRRRLRALLEPHFERLRLTTVAPSGDQGLPWMLGNRVAVRCAGAVMGSERWVRVRERLGLGCSLAVSCHKPA